MVTRKRAQEQAEAEAQAQAQKSQDADQLEEEEGREQTTTSNRPENANGNGNENQVEGEENGDVNVLNFNEEGSSEVLVGEHPTTATAANSSHPFSSIHNHQDDSNQLPEISDSNSESHLSLHPDSLHHNSNQHSLSMRSHSDLLSPMAMSAPPTTVNFFNNHPLQSHPDYPTSNHSHLSNHSPTSQGGAGEEHGVGLNNRSSPMSSSSNSFQQPPQHHSHQQPQTQQFFSDPFHRNAHLDESEEHHLSHQIQRPGSSSGLVGGGSNSDYLSNSNHSDLHRHNPPQMGPGHGIPPLGGSYNLPPPVHQQFNFPQYMHRASISGPIPTHGIYPPPNPTIQHNNAHGSPHADQMAAWANSAGGARPHTADGMFGHFGGFPGSWGGVPAGMEYRGPRASTGSISGSVASPPPQHDPRVFSHMSTGEEDVSSNSIASGSGNMLGDDQNPDNAEGSGPTAKKRPRRRYDEIERLYNCGWQGCAKSYGTLNHLNAHVSMQKHGEKRSPTEFKEMRRAWRRGKREEEQRRQQAQARANEDAMVRAKMAAHFDPNMGRNGSYSGPSGMAPPQTSHPVYAPPAPGIMNHTYVPSQNHHHHPHHQTQPQHQSHMQAPPQQMSRYSLSGPPVHHGNEGDHSPYQSHETTPTHDSRPFTSAGSNQHPVAYLMAHRGSI